MNLYSTLAAVKLELGIAAASTVHDARLWRYLEGCSRAIDMHCHRFFYTETGVRYQTAKGISGKNVILLDADVLSISAFAADSENDGTYDGEAWVENTDYWLWPYSSWPKVKVEEAGYGGYCFVTHPRRYKITGTWGYGDGLRAAPWDVSGWSGSLSDASDTSLAITGDASAAILAGQTLKIESEQVFVEAVSYANPTTTATVLRGVNGTTAAGHATAAVSIAAYPADVRNFCSWLVQSEFNERGKQGMAQERMGDYFYTRMVNDVDKKMMRCLAPYVREF